jgi:hypothetical protein
MFSDDERKNLARHLVGLASGIPDLGAEIRAAGFSAWMPIEAFELSFCSTEEIRLRHQILLEEAKERLGSTSSVLFRTEDGQGATAYISPLLDSMRRKRDEQLQLPPGSEKPRGLFDYNYLFFEPRRRMKFALTPGQRGTEGLNQAWEEAYCIMNKEGEIRFSEIPDTRWEGLGFGFSVDPKLVAHHLNPLGFDLPAKLRISSYIVARLTIGSYWLLFCIDATHPMQPRFVLMKPYEDRKMLLQRRAQIQLPMQNIFLAPIGGGAPYSHPKTPRQLATSVAYFAVVLKYLVPKIRNVLVF